MAVTGGRALTALAVLALVAAPPPVEGTLRDLYAEALTAMEAGEWRQAEFLFREAVALHPDEARRLPLRRIFRPYLPHYYLGAVLAQRGDCRGALAEWRLSAEQGVAAQLGLGDEIGSRRSSCEQRLERLALAATETESELGRAERTATELSHPSRAQLLGLGFEGGLGTLGQRLDASRDRISEARVRLDDAAAAQDPDLAEAAQRLARETALELQGALEELEQIGRRVAEERAHKRRRIEEVGELARRLDELLRARGSLPPSLHARRQELESLIAGAISVHESATLEQIEGLERRLDAFYRLLEGSEAPPPGTLRSGAIAFLRADYQATLERLAEIPYRDPKSRAHSLLLRSAAAYALHLAGGESDPALLERARQDVVAARRSAPGLKPAPSAFSPRFVRFFERVADAPPGA